MRLAYRPGAVPVCMNQTGIHVQRKYSFVKNQREGTLLGLSAHMRIKDQPDYEPRHFWSRYRKLAGYELRMVSKGPFNWLPNLLRG
jgi:hypothetical protein